MRFLLITLVACVTSGVFAQKNDSEPTKSNPPKKPMYAAFSKRTFPQPVGFVNDFSVLFESAERDSLNIMCARYEKKTGHEIVVVTIDSPYRNQEDMKRFSSQLSHYWAIGKKDRNNGILILICPETRKVRIHPGPAFKDILTEKDTEKIIKSNILAHYKDNKYYTGTKAGIEEIMMLIDERSK